MKFIKQSRFGHPLSLWWYIWIDQSYRTCISNVSKLSFDGGAMRAGIGTIVEGDSLGFGIFSISLENGRLD